MMASADAPNREAGLPPKLLDAEELLTSAEHLDAEHLDAEESVLSPPPSSLRGECAHAPLNQCHGLPWGSACSAKFLQVSLRVRVLCLLRRKRAVNAQQQHESHLDHPLDEHGKPAVQHLYWSFAVILEPKPLPEMLDWLRAGLSRARTVGELGNRGWQRLAEESLEQEALKEAVLELTPGHIETMVQYATEHKWYDSSRSSGGNSEEGEPFAKFVIEVAEKIDKAGLRMQLVQRTETSKHSVVLLIRCPEDLFAREHKEHCIRRWKSTGQGVEFYTDEEHDGLQLRWEPTEADRIQLTALLLTMDEARGGCGFGNLEHLDDDEDHDPRIVAAFPLHNPEYVETITAVR